MEPTGSLPHDEPPQDDMDPTLSFLDDTWPDDLSYISLKAFDMTLFRYASEDQVVGAEVVEPEAEEEKVHMKKETFHTSKQKRIIKKKNSIIKSDYDKEISIETVVNKSEPYHIRQKQELKYLREKVQALQNELKQLEKKKEEEKNKKHILTTISTTSESVSSSKSTEERDADLIWKRVAKQQSLEKHKSLIENTRLKKMVQDQIKVAKSLERIIRKRSHLSILETFPKSNKAKKNRLYFETTTNIQEELFQNIDRVYANFDTLYQKSSVYPIQKDWKNSQIFVKEQLEENINTVYLESSEVRCFPFSFESTVNCFWNLIAGLSELSFVEGMQRVSCYRYVHIYSR
jgi:hypothetical protein